ncbi:MAG: hypothetical protein ACREYE_15945, partial [Gammaproteobacteria bacterium]
IIKKIERARVKMEQIKPRSTLPRGKKEGGLTVKLFKGHYTSRLGLCAAPKIHEAGRRSDSRRNWVAVHYFGWSSVSKGRAACAA